MMMILCVNSHSQRTSEVSKSWSTGRLSQMSGLTNPLLIGYMSLRKSEIWEIRMSGCPPRPSVRRFQHHALHPRRVHQSANTNFGFCDQRTSCKFVLSALWSPIHLWSPPRYSFPATNTTCVTPPDAHCLSRVQFILGLCVLLKYLIGKSPSTRPSCSSFSFGSLRYRLILL